MTFETNVRRVVRWATVVVLGGGALLYACQASAQVTINGIPVDEAIAEMLVAENVIGGGGLIVAVETEEEPSLPAGWSGSALTTYGYNQPTEAVRPDAVTINGESADRVIAEMNAVESNPYLALHVSELWLGALTPATVERLVAENTVASIGGRILVGEQEKPAAKPDPPKPPPTLTSEEQARLRTIELEAENAVLKQRLAESEFKAATAQLQATQEKLRVVVAAMAKPGWRLDRAQDGTWQYVPEAPKPKEPTP